jgi:hypothetical protein
LDGKLTFLDSILLGITSDRIPSEASRLGTSKLYGGNELSVVRGATGKTYHCGGREERMGVGGCDQTRPFVVMASDLPTPTVLADAANLHVFDLNGQKVSFGSLFESRKSIFVFIRSVHLFLFLKFTISSLSIHLQAISSVGYAYPCPQA